MYYKFILLIQVYELITLFIQILILNINIYINEKNKKYGHTRACVSVVIIIFLTLITFFDNNTNYFTLYENIELMK